MTGAADRRMALGGLLAALATPLLAPAAGAQSLARFAPPAGELLYRRRLTRELGNGEAIIAKKPRLYHMSLMSLTYMNLLVMMRALPFSVFDRCGLDIDRLYPLHRRALALIDLKLNGGNYLRHCRNALDRMRALHGVRCGPLPAAEARSEDADISVPEERPAPAGTIAKAA